MIYEMSLVVNVDSSETDIQSFQKLVQDVITEKGGEVLIQDDWDKLSFAQPTSEGVEKGHFLYFVYRSGSAETNPELARRFRINEKVLRHMVLVIGDDSSREDFVKTFKTPYSKTYNGSILDDKTDGATPEKDRRRFSKASFCWFTKNNLRADWKDPKTFSWLINEFGKISPARVSGISRKHQRFATTAIKRARQIGIASNISNRLAIGRRD